MSKRFYILVLLAIAGWSFSCSYRLVSERSASLPSGVNDISIPLARNLTIEAALEDVFTMELIQRLSADGRVEILTSGEADAELRCVLEEITTHPVSYTREGRISAESVIIEGECSLVVPESESVVWRSGRLTASEEYPIGDNYLANEDARSAAILEVCKDLTESVRHALLDSF